MVRSTRLARLFGATALALGVIAGVPAAATTGALAGSVTLVPGSSPAGCVPQRLTFDGTITVTGTTRVEPVRFEGTSDGCETTDTGAGSGTFTGGLPGTATYVRSGDAIMVYGAEELFTKLKELLGDAALCVFLPSSVYPELQYGMHCLVDEEDTR